MQLRFIANYKNNRTIFILYTHKHYGMSALQMHLSMNCEDAVWMGMCHATIQTATSAVISYIHTESRAQVPFVRCTIVQWIENAR